MFHFKNKITLDCRQELQEFLLAYPHKTSGLTFASLYMWRNCNRFSYEIMDDYLCISGVSNLEDCPEEPFIFPPLPRSGIYEPKRLRRVMSKVREIYESNGFRLIIRLLPKHMQGVFEEAFPGRLKFIEDRANYDYVYDVQSLIDLKGRAYHGKKNHLNYFKTNYTYEYVPMKPDMADEAIEFIQWLNTQKEPEEGFERMMLDAEAHILRDAFINMDKIGLFGGAVYMDGKMQGLSLGSRLDNDTIVEHIEKANVEYRGLYQLVNNEFCKNYCTDAEFLNREEDIGLPGLRKSKLSYKPIYLQEKFVVVYEDDIEELEKNGLIFTEPCEEAINK